MITSFNNLIKYVEMKKSQIFVIICLICFVGGILCLPQICKAKETNFANYYYN